MSHRFKIDKEQITGAVGELELTNQTQLSNVAKEAASKLEAAKKALEAADAQIRKDFEAADKDIRKDLKDQGVELQGNIESLETSVLKKFSTLQVAWKDPVEGSYAYSTDANALVVGDRAIVDPLGDGDTPVPSDPFHAMAGSIATRVEDGTGVSGSNWTFEAGVEGDCLYDDGQNRIKICGPNGKFVVVAKFLGNQIVYQEELDAALEALRKSLQAKIDELRQELITITQQLQADLLAESASRESEDARIESAAASALSAAVKALSDAMSTHAAQADAKNTSQDNLINKVTKKANNNAADLKSENSERIAEDARVAKEAGTALAAKAEELGKASKEGDDLLNKRVNAEVSARTSEDSRIEAEMSAGFKEAEEQLIKEVEELEATADIDRAASVAFDNLSRKWRLAHEQYARKMFRKVMRFTERMVAELREDLYVWTPISGSENYACDYANCDHSNFVVEPLTADITLQLPDEGRMHYNIDYDDVAYTVKAAVDGESYEGGFSPEMDIFETKPPAKGRCDLQGTKIRVKCGQMNGYTITVDGGNSAIDGKVGGLVLELDQTHVTFIHMGSHGWRVS